MILHFYNINENVAYLTATAGRLTNAKFPSVRSLQQTYDYYSKGRISRCIDVNVTAVELHVTGAASDTEIDAKFPQHVVSAARSVGRQAGRRALHLITDVHAGSRTDQCDCCSW